MDFNFSPEAEDAAALTAQILTAEVSRQRWRDGTPESVFDADLWRTLGESGLLELTVPSQYGGAGLTLIEAARVVIELGRVVAPVPASGHIAALSVLGEVAPALPRPDLVAVAVDETDEHAPAFPRTSATPTEVAGEPAGWALTGQKVAVTAGMDATAFLISASTPTGVGLFLAGADDPGVQVIHQPRTGDQRGAVVHLEAAPVDGSRLIGAPDGETARRLVEIADTLLAAEQLGVCEGALALTAAYATQREQFGRPIGTFQAVSQRLADGYIETLGARLTLWQALWLLSEHRQAGVEVSTATLWAADAGHTLAHTTVHVHGGVGIDLDGSAHRYFSAATRLQFSLGGTTAAARRIGAALAATA